MSGTDTRTNQWQLALRVSSNTVKRANMYSLQYNIIKHVHVQ